MNDITREDEVRYLQEKIAKNLIFSSSVTFDDIIAAIQRGDIELEPLDEDGKKTLDSKHIDEIKKSMKALISISNKPRSFIKSLEEKVPVELAKKINHKAIMSLSKDSNDWHSRTLLSVHPKNIVSDVNEETFNLYENRFIVSLVDKIGKLINQAKIYYMQQKSAYAERRANNAMNEEYYHNTKSFPLFNKISKTTDYFGKDSGFIKSINDILDKITEIEKKIRIIRSSELFTVLRGCRKVIDPIQKTNILMYDHNYKVAYKLWKTLSQFIQVEDVDLTPIDSLDHNLTYKIYIMLMIFASLYDMGFSETTNNKIKFTNFNIDNTTFIFVKSDLKIELEIDDIFIFRIEYKENNIRKLDEFHVISNFVDFENKNRLEVKSILDEITDKMKIHSKEKNVTGKYTFVSMNMTRCAKNNELPESLYRRFYNIGDNYSYEETNEFIKEFGFYRSGIQIIIPTSLRNNFLHIERLLNYHILSHLSVTSLDNLCPICGSQKIRKLNSNDYICKDCSHMISIASHPTCKIDNKKKFLWIKYVDDKFLNRKEIIGEEYTDVYTKINLYQNVMGEYGINSFVIEKEGMTYKLKTICPCCGHKLGE